MNPFPIPVRAAPLLGPGSQPDEGAALDVMPLPREMHTFEMPPVPQQAPPGTLEAATELLAGLLRNLRAWDFASGEDGPRVDLCGLPAPVLDIVGQVLGEGEVSIRVDGEQPLRIQETAFAGLWRCCRLDARGVRLHDWIEAGAVPGVVPEAARAGTAAGLAEAPLPPGVMNAPASRCGPTTAAMPRCGRGCASTPGTAPATRRWSAAMRSRGMCRRVRSGGCSASGRRPSALRCPACRLARRGWTAGATPGARTRTTSC